MNGGTIIAIVLIVIGIIVFAVSFFYLDLKDKYQEKEHNKSNLSNLALEKQEDELIDIANEKLTAINEYYTYVMEEIEKKHKELLFLYHMVSEKDNEIKQNAEHIGSKINEIFTEKEKAFKNNKKDSVGVQSTSQAAEFYKIQQESEQASSKRIISEDVKSSNKESNSQTINNNDIILDLYGQGCSINEIATKLGIGLGEVKLVIHLFSEVNL